MLLGLGLRSNHRLVVSVKCGRNFFQFMRTNSREKLYFSGVLAKWRVEILSAFLS